MNQCNYLVTVDADGNVNELFCDAPGFASPPTEAVPVSHADGELMRIFGHHRFRLVSGAAVMRVDPRAAIAKTYADVDGIYAIAIGNRAEEYKQAEADARAFKAGGYAGTPTEYISGWAAAKGLTNQQSADAIIARADALAAVKLALRNQRFQSQAAMQAAVTQAELDTAVATWDAFINSVRGML